MISTSNDTDERFMRRALVLARRGRGRTSPNPMVGALVVAEGKIVAEGYHPRAGEPHAEVFALRAAGARTTGATLYTTLEPCCTTGRTGPCTELIVAGGISRVVIGATDPNPAVAGRGEGFLREAGLLVETAVLQDEATALNEIYNKFITTRQPFVTLKIALSLDGKITARKGTRTPLSGPRAKAYVRRLRAEHDAVAIGSRTALIDDPLLKGSGARQPLRVVLDSGAALPLDSQLVSTAAAMRILVAVTPRAPADNREGLVKAGVTVMECREKNGMLSLVDLLDQLAKLEVTSVLVEAGSVLATSLVGDGLVDKLVLVVSPQLLGGNGPSMLEDQAISGKRLSITSHRKFGEDLVITAYPHHVRMEL